MVIKNYFIILRKFFCFKKEFVIYCMCMMNSEYTKC